MITGVKIETSQVTMTMPPLGVVCHANAS